MKYAWLTHTDERELITLVEAYLAQGWQLVGGPFVYRRGLGEQILAQAIVWIPPNNQHGLWDLASPPPAAD